MTIKLVLFDFDGTIADSRATFVKIANRLAPRFGYKTITELELKKLTNLSSQEIIQQANISKLKLLCILRKIRQEFSQEVQSLKPITQIDSSLFALRNAGYELNILTSNAKKNVELFLIKNEIDALFTTIHSGITLFGKDKVIKRILRSNKLSHHEVIYVGDETRDIAAAKESKIAVIAVGWGFNSPEVLSQFQPDFLIQTPAELIKVIQSLNQSNDEN